MFFILLPLFALFMLLVFVGIPGLALWTIIGVLFKARRQKHAHSINLYWLNMPGTRPSLPAVSPKVLSVIAGGFLCGFLSWVFFSVNALGVQVLLASLVLHSVTFGLMHAYRQTINTASYVLAGSSAAISTMFLLRGSDTLMIINLLALLMINLALIASLAGLDFGKSKAAHYFVAPLISGLYAVLGAGGFVLSLIKTGNQSRPKAKTSKTLDIRKRFNTETLIGISLALPLIGIFGALFASADSRFAELLPDLNFNWSLDFDWLNNVGPAVITTLIVGSILFSIMFYLTNMRPDKFTVSSRQEKPFLPLKSAQIILASMVTMFAVFALMQMPVILGVDSADTTLAENARGGFFQLLFVASLALGVTSILTSITRDLLKSAVAKGLAIGWIGLTLVVLVSAFRRLLSYEQEFGYTLSRFFAYASMLLIGVWLIAYAIRLYNNLSARWYAQVVFGTCLVWLMGINLINPERIIAQTNIDRASATRELDLDYIARLSSDSWLAIFDAIEDGSFDSDQQKRLDQHLCRSYVAGGHNHAWHSESIEDWNKHATDWRAWNIPRAALHDQVQDRLNAEICSELISKNYRL